MIIDQLHEETDLHAAKNMDDNPFDFLEIETEATPTTVENEVKLHQRNSTLALCPMATPLSDEKLINMVYSASILTCLMWMKKEEWHLVQNTMQYLIQRYISCPAKYIVYKSMAIKVLKLNLLLWNLTGY